MEKQKALRNLPRIDSLVKETCDKAKDLSYHAALEGCRRALESVRQRILEGNFDDIPPIEDIVSLAQSMAHKDEEYSLKPVINASGVVIHTNLGRSVLSERAAENVKKIAMSYSTLEYDVKSGERGSRHTHIEPLLCALTGAEAAVAVNNNAAAVLLTLSALCAGREVIVSRGELVEIGGSFRVPEIMALGGAVLREVGTTNKTKPADYARAVCENSAALLKVSTSNFKIVGFVEEVGIKQLSEIGRAHDLPVIYDLGAGLMFDNINNSEQSFGGRVLDGETSVAECIKSGVDIVCFSGDKLFGGTQAGIIVGRKKYIDLIKKHQLARALRIDKLSLAALEATLKEYKDPVLARQIPTIASITTDEETLRERAEKLRKMLQAACGFSKKNLCDNTDCDWACDAASEKSAEDKTSGITANKQSGDLHCQKPLEISLRKSEGQVGGGSLPGELLPSYVVEIRSDLMSAGAIEKRLRESETPIITRINRGSVLLDVRTVFPAQLEIIARAIGFLAEELRGKTEQISSGKATDDKNENKIAATKTTNKTAGATKNSAASCGQKGSLRKSKSLDGGGEGAKDKKRYGK